MTSPLRRFRRRTLVIGIVLPLGIAFASVMIVMASASASPGAPGPPPSKASAPANINPSKTPVLDPSAIKKDPVVPLTKAEARQQALAWVAQDPNSRVACFAADGSLAGVVELDKVDPSAPVTAAQAAEVCGQWPGSAPGSTP